MNYFSSGKKSISDLMDTYINAFSIPVNNTVMDKETAIHQHYHAYCQNKALRGFQFIADQHKMNRFHTSRYCYPVRVTVNQNNAALNRRHNTLLKRILKKRDGLAMILMENGTHAIVVGFDRRKGGYFFRNPQRFENAPLLNRQDFLKDNDMFEYIVFERYKKRCLKR